MPNQVLSSVENNFTKGLVTEFTGLNFPENAATDTDNCNYQIVGDVTRRLGIDREVNGNSVGLTRSNYALSDYKWDNAGGDGTTQIVVRQSGNGVYFFLSSKSTTVLPLSTQKLSGSIDLGFFVAAGNTFDATAECQYSSGNGYLFIYHKSCDPVYVTYSGGVVSGNRIAIKIRDFTGVVDGLTTNTRPLGLSVDHQYNLINQGWVSGSAWNASSGSAVSISTGGKSFFVGAGITGISPGQLVRILCVTGGTISIPANTPVMSGTVTSYTAGVLSINVITATTGYLGDVPTGWTIQPISTGYIDTWFSAVGNYPSNADVWWYYKNTSGVFDPATTNGNITISTGNAPRGHFTLDAFNQQRSTASGVAGLTSIQTTLRPKTGTWFQGRVWYTGVDASQQAVGDANQYSWSENIYFSQIVVDPSQFGNCFQQNDPTSENLFDILPTDGGVIVIQGSGSIYQLFPIQNGLLVFAGNGVWFITGSQGIGFAANDYTITKISSVQSISCTSYVNVNGLPYFWNEEGIYAVQPSQGGGLEVNPLTVGTILSFFNTIPVACKKYARGAYHPIDYVIQWVYRDTNPATFNDTYSFNRILNYNTYNKAFFPYTVDNSNASINGILYVNYPGGSTAPDPGFKYPASFALGNATYADEHDGNFLDWKSYLGTGVNYTSYFITGYKLHGQGQRRFQIPYIYMYSRNDEPTSYKIQGIWNYATTGNSGKWSVAQLINNFNPNFGVIFRRHRIRGQGLILQLKVTSTDGMPLDIIGWSTFESQNMGV